MNNPYALMLKQLDLMLESEQMYVPALANAAALLFNTLENINWAGFYLLHNGELVLAPFMGKPACVRIAIGKGVCGTAVLLKKTQLVSNVHQFPGHIACDNASNSEIVVPLFRNGKVIGVMDIDSPLLSRFDENDQKGLELFAKSLETKLLWENYGFTQQ